MAKEAERLAKRENRTMSELLREAFRQYSANGKPQVSGDLYALLRTIADAKTHPLSASELEAEDKRLMRVGAAQANKVGSKERDAVRLVHESRARRSAS
jgi:hypothetical protein